MKITRRVIGLVLVFAMLISMSAIALTFPDVAADNGNQEAIDVLSSLGIIKGYEDGTFKPDKEVTRAELTSLLMRLLNLSITGTTVADSGYTDVANDHWAVYDIKTASSREIIRGFGDGRFGPEESVTYEQAVKMVVAMLGYEYNAIQAGGWPNGYMKVASDLGILKKTSMNQEAPAPRKIIAQILFNALSVDLMEKKILSDTENVSYEILKGTTLMTKYMKIEKVEGKVVANASTRFDDQESELQNDEIEIKAGGASRKFKIGACSNAVDLIGLDVVAYINNNAETAEEIIKYIDTKSEVKSVSVDAEDIVDFTVAKLTYEKGDNAKNYTYSLAANPVVMYNGKYIDTNYAFANKLTEPEVGTVTLVDSGSGYNLIKVDNYSMYIVKTVDTSSSFVYVNKLADANNTSSSSESLKIEVPVNNKLDYNITIKKDDKDITLSSIKKDNIIAVKESDSTQVGIKIIDILVSDAKKTGKVTGREEDVVTIDSKQYTVANSIIGTETDGKIKNNASGTFYLDAFGKIAYATFATGDTYKYGYIVKSAISNKDTDPVGAVKIYDYSSKSLKNINFANKLTIDGELYSDHEVAVSKLEESAALLEDRAKNENAQTAQPIKYMLNNSGLISEINTVKFESGKESDSGFVPGAYSDKAQYYSTNKYFKSGSATIAKLDSSSVIFSVPNDRTEDKKYSIKTSSYFKNGANYDIEIVETNEKTGNVAVMIVYESNQDENVHFQSPTVLVTEIKTVYEDGETKQKVMGYDFKSGANIEKGYAVEDASYVDGIEKGDVIRFGVNSEGEINQNVYKYLDISEVVNSDINSNKYPELPDDKANFKDNTLYPLRRISFYENYNSSYVQKPSLSNLSSKYSYFYGTPVSTLIDSQKSLTFTDYIPTDEDFGNDETRIIPFEISNTTVFFEYNANESDVNKLKITPSSSKDDRASNLAGIKTSEISGKEDCDTVLIYLTGDRVKTVYVIKKK